MGSKAHTTHILAIFIYRPPDCFAICGRDAKIKHNDYFTIKNLIFFFFKHMCSTCVFAVKTSNARTQVKKKLRARVQIKYVPNRGRVCGLRMTVDIYDHRRSASVHIP